MRCPTCNAPSPDRFPATSFEGEVSYFCPDLYHYNEAMRWRDWQTCDDLLDEREGRPWYRG